uniref:Type 2 serotonin receptor n=1 Tax=Procambarus clarkii TaxID=6728 RepID=B0F4P8_PROCL|nr:type 2 serotonin receptor [Procambarus clarkii]
MPGPGGHDPTSNYPIIHLRDHAHSLNPVNLTFWSENGTQPGSWQEEGVVGGVGSPGVNWWGLVALLVVLLTLFGNILLILAISWDRRLQNMTNYFLLSLAVTDLMVASLVMPLSIVVLVLGRFPFSSELCLLWISLDVLFCTASIMHLCTLSVDRFLSLRYPMKFGRHKTRRRVVLKIVLVWCLSLAASLPLSLMYATDPHSTIVDGVCQIPVSLFQIIGSVICFYIPLTIMLVTYTLTARLLSKKQMELQATVLETSSASPSPRSVRWKKLLCKTTSNLSTSTAVSLTDGELEGRLEAHSEEGKLQTCAEQGKMRVRCEEGKLRRFGSSPLRRPPLVRYTAHHYRAALVRGGSCGARGYSSRELKTDGSVMADDDRMFPHLAASAGFELSVLASGPRSAPSSTTTSPMHRPQHDAEGSHATQMATGGPSGGPSGGPVKEHDSSFRCEQNGDPGRRGGGEECGAGDASHVTVPCSCAPRFFLEDIKTSSESQCDECSDLRPQDMAAPYRSHHNRRSHSQERRRGSAGGGCCSCILPRLTRTGHSGSQGVEAALSSPWREASITDLVTRTTLRSGGQVTTLLHKTTSSESSSVSSVPSSRGLWRQRSCSSSIKYVSSKRHGRSIRMEQKATKVLGVVFFTFVLLWAPFFIANVLISCGAHIKDEMINFVTWLGYASSMVNPFFYTFFNKTFRQTFLKIIKCEMRRSRKYHF